MKSLYLFTALCLLAATCDARPRVFTKKFAAVAILAGLATVADVEMTAHCVQMPACIEGNSSIYGIRPSRARLYAINAPITALGILVAYGFKHEGYNTTWWIPVAPIVIVHSYAAVHGIGVMDRAERLCPSGTTCVFK
jgi:hypothetical protein